jgi:long-chain acyl-CoA synthetase
MLTHKNFMTNLDACMKACFFDERDVLLGVLPLFHSFALTTCLILPARLGALVLYMRRFAAAAALDLIAKHRVTATLAIPSMYRVLVRAVDKAKHDTRSLRLCVAGGEACPQELSVAFRKAFDLPLLEGYGLTETSPVVSVNSPEHYKLGTAGRPLVNLEVCIAEESGQLLPPGAEGEIWVRGPSIMPGYYKRPDLTREAITPEGWFKTGDYGRLDADGFLAITGRKKELIISSGENISPNEIEAVIAQHPKVFEVAVLPEPDKVRGEVPKAYVALHPGVQCTEQEVRDFCEGRLAKHKIPRYVEFRAQLPHGPTGKVLKRAIK